MLNSGQAVLLDDGRLRGQLVSLERRTARGGRDSIDHPLHQQDDLANAAAGALQLAKGGGTPYCEGVTVDSDREMLHSAGRPFLARYSSRHDRRLG